CNDDLEKRRIDLLAQLEEFRKSLAVFLADQRAWIVADLTAQQEQASAACREQTAVISRLDSEKAEALAAVRKASGLTSSCRALLNGCEAEKPNLDAWPSRADVARWEAEHSRLSEALEAAQEAEGQARSELRRIQARILEAERKLNALADAELTLRERLSGEAWSDHEVGLQHSPEV
ncbi:MAG TPA: hypothetical protein VEG68_13955, partial [Terriglobales bacterium]|nr:hypothetical protein [Terriglobales bacterium]